MSEIFNALPGIEVPVGEISRGLTELWTEGPQAGKEGVPEEMGATQANVVLHFGFATTPEDALMQFHTAVRFASRYPSRFVVLCPMHDDALSEAVIRAKIYGECFLGKTKEDTRCCEFVLLNYSQPARRHLESQVSVCLSSDLPLYYWAHRFTANHRLADYHYLLTKAQRFIFDSAYAPQDSLSYPWPNPTRLRDLAYARTLPLRQSIGQFLARTAPRVLAEGLKTVTVSSEEVHRAEGQALERWVKERLADCGVAVEQVVWFYEPLPHAAGNCFGLQFDYSAGKYFRWQGNCHTGVSGFESNFGSGDIKLPSHISLLAPEQALSEAMFF